MRLHARDLTSLLYEHSEVVDKAELPLAKQRRFPQLGIAVADIPHTGRTALTVSAVIH